MVGLFKTLLSGAGRLITTGAILGGTVAGGEVLVNGKNSYAVDYLKRIQEGIGGAGAEAGADITKTGIFSFLKMIGEFLMVASGGKLGRGLVDFANRGINYDSDVGMEVPGTPEAEAAAKEAGVDVVTNASAPAEFKTATGNMITAGNEITLANLYSTEEFDTWSEVGHKGGLVLQGAASEGLSIASSVTGHAADGIDWLVGAGLEKVFDYDTGYAKRDLSTDFHKVVMDNVAPKPELVTAWDRVAFGTGQTSTYFIPGAFIAGKTAQLAVGGAAAVSTYTAEY